MTDVPGRAAAVRVASFGARPVGRIEVPVDEWFSFLAIVKGERITGLATAAAEAKALVADPTSLQDLQWAQRAAMLWALEIERALLRISAAAAEVGIDSIVLKGPALAHCFYPDPTWRGFADLDLMVRSRDWRRACELLERLGFRRKTPQPTAGFDERFGKAAEHDDDRGVAVDLHRTLVLGPFGLWMQPERLFDMTVPFDVAGVTLRRLDDTALLLHACIHASLGWRPPLLQPIRDIAQIAALGAIDWDAFTGLAREWRLNAVVAHAFSLVRDTLGASLPAAAASLLDAPSTRGERRALEAYVSDRRTRSGTARSALRAIPGVRGKIAYLRAMLVPDAAFLAARASSGGQGSYVRRWTVPFRWLNRRRSHDRR